MKNFIVCSSCKTENAFYETVCINCKSYLRGRVYNIDLGYVLARLIESPTQGFKKIIFSEHKNFLTFLIILAAVKLEIDSVFVSLFFSGSSGVSNGFMGNYFVFLIALSVFILIFSYLLNILNKLLGYSTRTKDNFSILVYSLIPHIFALIILFTLELVMFGEYLFSINPSPFDLKEFTAYSLLLLEVFVIIWSLFLTIMANYTQTKNVIYSITVSIIFHSFIFYFLYLFPKII